MTPIYWQPAGGKYAFPRSYEELINRYVRDIARASGHETNVYSNATEYYQKSNGHEDVHHVQDQCGQANSRYGLVAAATDVSRRRASPPASPTTNSARSFAT